MSDEPIVNAKELKNALRALGSKKAKRALQTVFRKYAKEIRNRALPNVPESTGRLKDTIKVRLKFNRTGHIRALVTAGSKIFNKKLQAEAGHKGAFYAGFQEYGFTDRAGKFHEGKHFLSDALEAVKPAVIDNIKTELAAEIEKQGGGDA